MVQYATHTRDPRVPQTRGYTCRHIITHTYIINLYTHTLRVRGFADTNITFLDPQEKTVGLRILPRTYLVRGQARAKRSYSDRQERPRARHDL
jgi:hypothetical protein